MRNCVSVGLCFLIYRVIPSLNSSQVILVTSSVSIIHTASDLMVHIEGPDAPSNVWLSECCVGAPVTVTEDSDALSHGRKLGLSPQASATPPSISPVSLASLGYNTDATYPHYNVGDDVAISHPKKPCHSLPT